ncbi:hypothetical protein TA3x_000640 [Tundrisphaera sp. TA3]|uniref:hypothetical protein n=1 Tax=Tundrisphaera sp. TA3 TaxID=3435775 RepID=UPI003EC0817E
MDHRRVVKMPARVDLNPPLRRRFTLLDAMLVVAAFAAILAVHRWNDMGTEWWTFFRNLRDRRLWSWKIIPEIPFRLAGDASFPMLILSFTVFASRLMSPRPRWRRLARQPGFVACLAIVPAGIIGLALTIIEVNRFSAVAYPSGGLLAKERLSVWLQTLSMTLAEPCGFAVAMAWSTQALVGGWRPKDDWVDRLGRVVGCTWVAMAMARLFRSMLFYL